MINWLIATLQLRYGNVNARLAAIATLIASGGLGSWALLNRAVQDRDARVRQGAITALGFWFGPKAIGILITALRYDQNKDVRMEAADRLVQIGKDAILPLTDVLRSKDPTDVLDPNIAPDFEIRVVDLLAQIGQDAILPLIDVLRSNDSLNTSLEAARALGRIGGPQTVSSLMAVINDTSGTVRYAAIFALVSVLRLDMDESIRKRAADLLVQIGQDAVSYLISASQDSTTSDPALAVQALGRIGGLQAVSSLTTLLNDARDPVSEAAAEALGIIGGRLKSKNAMERLSAVKALDIIGGMEAVESLVQTLEDEDSEVSWEAALALERKPNRNNIMSRVLALEETDGHIPGIAYLLAQYSDLAVIDRLQKHVPAIIPQLKGENPIQRLAAVKALDVIGGSEAIGALVEILNDPDDRVSYAIAKALARRGDSATIQAKLSEWETSNKGMNYKNNEAVNTLIAASAALNSNELRSYTEGKSEETHKNIRAQLEKQLDKLLDRYAPDTFGG